MDYFIFPMKSNVRRSKDEIYFSDSELSIWKGSTWTTWKAFEGSSRNGFELNTFETLRHSTCMFISWNCEVRRAWPFLHHGFLYQVRSRKDSLQLPSSLGFQSLWVFPWNLNRKFPFQVTLLLATNSTRCQFCFCNWSHFKLQTQVNVRLEPHVGTHMKLM